MQIEPDDVPSRSATLLDATAKHEMLTFRHLGVSAARLLFSGTQREQTVFCLGCEALTLVNVLAVPATGEAFNNPRRLSTMPIQSLVKLGALTVIGEPLLDANMVR